MYCIYVCIFHSCGFVTTHWHSLIESIQTKWKGKIINSINQTVHATNKKSAIIDSHWKRLYSFKVIYNATHTVICTFSIRQSMCEWFYSENIWRCGIWRRTSLLVLLNCTRGTASRLVLLNCTKGVSLFNAKPLSEPIPIDWQMDSQEQNVRKLKWKYDDFCSRKWIWSVISKIFCFVFNMSNPHTNPRMMSTRWRIVMVSGLRLAALRFLCARQRS